MSAPGRAKATIADVARAAGVSQMTVSRVLNGRGGAGTDTRARVLAAAKALDYRPNAFAKGLKVGQSQTVGVVVPDITNPFFPEIVRGAELVARAEGYTLLLGNVFEDPEREADVLATLLERQVDGVILCSARLNDRRLAEAIGRHRAVVLVNRAAPRALAGSVEVDYQAGASQLVDHLVARGRHRIAVLAGPPASHGGRQRLAGLAAGLGRHGLALVHQEPCQPDFAGGVAAAPAILARLAAVDAVVCYNDLVALGLLSRLKTADVAVPARVAVAGFDDIPTAALVTPALTTLRIEKQALGELAMRLLIDRMQGDGRQQGLRVEPELVVRETA